MPAPENSSSARSAPACGEPAESREPVGASPWLRDLVLLSLAFGVLFGFSLGHSPLANPDEGRYAEIPREMLAAGDWVTPRLDGINYFEKPPLLYWCVALAEKILGPGEFALRLTPALFALGGVLLTYAAARRLHGRAAGLAGAIVLATSLLYFGVGQVIVLDTAVSVLMSATLFCFILGVREPPGARRRWFFYGLYASSALATLTKGLMGFLVTGAVMFLWLLVFNQWKRLRPLHLPGGLALFLAIALPWHVLAAQRNPTWFHRYIVFEHFGRFTTTAHGRYQPWWWFIPILLGGLFPWVGFLRAAMRDATCGRWARRTESENADRWFLVTWAAFVFLFFSASHSKLAPYILPVFPALAVLIGAWIARTLENEPARLGMGLRIFGFMCGLLAVALVMVVFGFGLVISDPAQAAALRPPAIGIAFVLLTGGVCAPWLAKIRGPRAGLGAMIVTSGLFLGGIAWTRPVIQKPGTKALALYVKTHAQPGDRVMHYFDFFHDFTFYAGRTVELVSGDEQARKHEFSELELAEDAAAVARGQLMGETELRKIWAQPARIFVVAKKRDVRGKRPDGQPALLSDPTFHYHLLAETEDHCLFSSQP